MAFIDQKRHLGFFFFVSVSVSAVSISADPPSPPTVYEILPKFGLPSGLLPDAVTSYSLSDDGDFVVNLEKPCYVQFDYLVYYDKQITGKLKYGSITDLKGIEVKRAFLWFDVDEIKVDLPPSDNIYFQVGFINKKLDVDQFNTVHSCRDKVFGLPCGRSWKQRAIQYNKMNMMVSGHQCWRSGAFCKRNSYKEQRFI